MLHYRGFSLLPGCQEKKIPYAPQFGNGKQAKTERSSSKEELEKQQTLAKSLASRANPPSSGDGFSFFCRLSLFAAFATAETDLPRPLFQSEGASPGIHNRVSRSRLPSAAFWEVRKGGRRRSFRKREAGREEEAGRRFCYQAAVLVGPFAGGTKKGDRSPKSEENSRPFPMQLPQCQTRRLSSERRLPSSPFNSPSWSLFFFPCYRGATPKLRPRKDRGLPGLKKRERGRRGSVGGFQRESQK